MGLAIFDLDNTLIAGDSDHAWGEFLVDQGIVDEALFRDANNRFYQDYMNGQLDIQSYLEFALEPLTRHEPEQLHAWRELFVEQRIKPLLQEKARTLLDWHRAQGHFLLIITATNEFVTAPIAELLGVDDLIATRPEHLDGRFTGRVAGTPSFREGKVTRLKEWLADRTEHGGSTWFYSDSHNDLPLLEQVDYPFAVDPDPQLKAIAEARQWPVISLREPAS